MSATRKLGRIPSPPSHDRHVRALRFNAADFPTPAPYDLRKPVNRADWGVMLNDREGDCAIAAIGHLVMAVSAACTGTPTVIPDAEINRVYRTLSPNDTGCVMEEVCEYLCAHGIGGVTFYGYAPVQPTDDAQFFTLGDLFGGVYIGVELPIGGTDGQPGRWSAGDRGDIGGHAINVTVDPGAAADEMVCTWGMPNWPMEQGFRRRRCDEAYVMLSSAHFGAAGLTWHGYRPSQMADWLQKAGGKLLKPVPADPSPSPGPTPNPTPDPAGGFPDLSQLV